MATDADAGTLSMGEEMLISYFCVTVAIGSTVFACQRCVGNAFRRWVLVCFPFIVHLLFLVRLYVFSFPLEPCFQTSPHLLSPCVIAGDGGGGDCSGGGALKCDGDGTIGCALLACANRCRVPSSLGCK